MTRKIILLILPLILCAAFLIHCTAPQDNSVTEPGSQIMPRETFPGDRIPAQPGEGPEGLPTPTV